MAYVPTVLAPRGDVFAQTSRPPNRGLIRKIFDAVVASQQRRAEAEILRFLRARGGRLTDDAEREIERRFLLPRHENLQAQGRSR